MEQSQANEEKKSQAICTLKVNIKCCNPCRSKAKEKLQNIDGLESIECDSNGVLTISGKVNPMIIVKKIEKWGKKAELLSLEQSPNQEFKPNGTDDFDHDDSNSQSKNDCCCQCDSISDSDSENQNHDSEVRGLLNKNNNHNPNITSNNNNSCSQNTKGNKVKKGCFGLFRKKNGGTEVNMTVKPPLTANGQSKWKFPSTPGLEYGGGPPRPYHQPFQPYHHPPMMGMPPPSGFTRPPPPPSYGVFNSRPPPKVNPMIHYTSYADNYSPW